MSHGPIMKMRQEDTVEYLVQGLLITHLVNTTYYHSGCSKGTYLG